MKITRQIKNLFKLQNREKHSGERDIFYMRDLLRIDREVSRNEHRLQALLDSRQQAEEEHEALVRLCDSLEQNLVLADSKHASRLIVGQLSHQLNRRDEMNHHVGTLNQQIGCIQELVETLRRRQTALNYAARQYFQQSAAVLPADLPEVAP